MPLVFSRLKDFVAILGIYDHFYFVSNLAGRPPQQTKTIKIGKGDEVDFVVI